jgi:hypothetical protein
VEDWGDNILKDVLKDGQSLELKFHPKPPRRNGTSRSFTPTGKLPRGKGYKLTEISKINLFWSKDKGSTATSE